jgi:hypothetical protein
MDGVQQPDSMLQLDSGKGLLDARAMWAAMVGPHRLAMANKYPFELYSNKATQLHRNLGAARRCGRLNAVHGVRQG